MNHHRRKTDMAEGAVDSFFEKPISVYVTVVLVCLLIGSVIYAHRQHVRNDILVQRIDYYKAQIASFDSAMTVRKDAYIQSEVIIKQTQDTATRLAEKGQELSENTKALTLEGDKKEALKNEASTTVSDDKLNGRMWDAYCKTNPTSKSCTKNTTK